MDNVGNLRYGTMDAVVTSPPYSEQSQDSRPIGGIKKVDKNLHVNLKNPEFSFGRRYSENSKNVGNLRHGNIDTVISSPPYEQTLEGGTRHHKKDGGHFKIIEDKQLPTSYSFRNEKQIGNLKSESYLSAMLTIYRECWKILKPNGKMILVLKNFIRNKKLVRLDLDTIRLCEHAGFTLQDRYYFRLPQKSFWRINYERKYPDAPKIEHEDILIFQKEAKP